jgi:hypothetical protein
MLRRWATPRRSSIYSFWRGWSGSEMQEMSGETLQAPLYPDWGKVGKASFLKVYKWTWPHDRHVAKSILQAICFYIYRFSPDGLDNTTVTTTDMGYSRPQLV